ncbi:MAG: prmC [Clostridiales bacterium]|nr:prmC [Clostridiales bacterium]
MKIFEAIKEACNKLNGFDSPQLDAEVILSHALNRDKIYLYINRDMELENGILEEFFKMIERRKNGEPVQYIVGKQEFMSLVFIVKPGVLIPRGDTEILVEETLKNMNEMKNPTIVDVGCGSGAISVSIAKYRSDALVYGIDKMDTPLEVTGINAEKNGVLDRVQGIKSDLLSSLDKSLYNAIDVLISNPPYIREDVIPTLMREVKDYEPFVALSGGLDGLYFYREITNQSLKFIKPGGFIAFEIGYDQGEDVKNILIENGFSNVYCKKDLAGNDRVVTGWR